MPERDPILPCGYELLTRAHTASVLDEACRLAGEGAPEGTLLWARSQDDCDLGPGKRWHSGRDNLHLAVVFRPDEDAPANLAQLTLLASVALGAAVAEHAPPWMALRYRWPNDVIVNEARLAAVHYRCARAADPQWAVLGVNANVASSPAELGMDATHLQEAACDIDAVDLLEGFSRHLLGWLDRWANEGPDAMLRAWRTRADDIGMPVTLVLDGRPVSGNFQGVDDSGAALVGDDGDTARRVTLDAYLREGRRGVPAASPPTA